MKLDIGASFEYAGKTYTLIQILPFTDDIQYFKLVEKGSEKVIFLLLLG